MNMDLTAEQKASGIKQIILSDWHPKNVNFRRDENVQFLEEYILTRKDEASLRGELSTSKPLFVEIPFAGDIGSALYREGLSFLLFLREMKVITDLSIPAFSVLVKNENDENPIIISTEGRYFNRDEDAIKELGLAGFNKWKTRFRVLDLNGLDRAIDCAKSNSLVTVRLFQNRAESELHPRIVIGDDGIYRKGNKKDCYAIKRGRLKIVKHLLANKKVPNDDLRKLIGKDSSEVNKAIKKINEIFRLKLKFADDLIIHRGTGGYDINKEHFEITQGFEEF
jgi:hypothetical protein